MLRKSIFGKEAYMALISWNYSLSVKVEEFDQQQ